MNKKLFTCQGIIIISVLLISGIVFVYAEKSGKLDQYFEKKNPPLDISKNIPPPKTYKIGFVSDAHAKVTKLGDVRSESKIPMLDFVFRMNNDFKPDFVVDGGDFIDGTRRFGLKSKNDHAGFSGIFAQIEVPKYHVLGNHELRGLTKREWLKMNNYEKSYYYFDYDKLRVIVFDSTLITESNEMTAEGQEFKKEFEWLSDLLKNSNGYKKIIFSHHPLVPILRKTMPLERVTELNELLSKYRVKAVFSGHVEVLYYEKIGGVDYFIIPGFYRSEATGIVWKGSFSEVNVGLKNKLRLFYKKENEAEYSSIIVPSQEYKNIEKEELDKVDFFLDSD